MRKFGERLKQLRNDRVEKQKDLAELLECSVRHYQAIEAGTINIPSKKLELLADHFEVSMDSLVGRTDDPQLHQLDE